MSDQEGPRWNVPDWSPKDEHRDKSYLDEIHELRLRAEAAEQKQTDAETKLKTLENIQAGLLKRASAAEQTSSSLRNISADFQRSVTDYNALKAKYDGLLVQFASLQKSQVFSFLKINRRRFWKALVVGIFALSVYGYFAHRQALSEQAQKFADRLETSQAETRQAKDQNTVLAQEKQALDAELASLSDVSALKTENDELTGTVSELRQEVAALQGQLSRSRTALVGFQDTINRLKGEGDTLPTRISNQRTLEDVVRQHLNNFAKLRGWNAEARRCVRQEFLEEVDRHAGSAFRSRPSISYFRDQVRDGVRIDTRKCFRGDSAGSHDRFVDGFFYANGNTWDRIVAKIR